MHCTLPLSLLGGWKEHLRSSSWEGGGCWNVLLLASIQPRFDVCVWMTIGTRQGGARGRRKEKTVRVLCRTSVMCFEI